MTNRKLYVYHGFASENDRMVKLELNRDTRNKLLSKYKVRISDVGDIVESDNYDIIIEKLSVGDNESFYYVVKNDSSCGGKHLMLLVDNKNLLAFGGKVKRNTLHIFGGGN